MTVIIISLNVSYSNYILYLYLFELLFI